jgi:hypothetical protein
METTIRKRTLRVAARFLEDALNADTSDYQGPQFSCACGKHARFIDRRSKTFTTILGNVTSERAYYYCFSCGKGWCPKDITLGFGDSAISPGVTRMIGMVASLSPFQESANLLGELAGINVTDKCVERTAKELGAAVAADEVIHFEEKPNLSDTMYAGVDGTGIPMRPNQLRDRPGKQPDGTAKTREVKECVVWTADSRDSEGKPVRDKGSVSYSAAIESCSWSANPDDYPPFAARVERELTRTGYYQAKHRVFIGDGAPWIWNLAGMIAPGAIQIVDLYHAKEHLSKFACEIFGAGSDLAKQWSADQHDNLETGNMDALLAAISSHITRSGEIGGRASKEYDYFNNNRERMRYDYFRSQELCVGSGVVEAGCRSVIGKRLKQSGMFWSLTGANDIIALRCCMLSGKRFDDFWARYRANNYAIPKQDLSG